MVCHPEGVNASREPSPRSCSARSPLCLIVAWHLYAPDRGRRRKLYHRAIPLCHCAEGATAQVRDVCLDRPDAPLSRRPHQPGGPQPPRKRETRHTGICVGGTFTRKFNSLMRTAWPSTMPWSRRPTVAQPAPRPNPALRGPCRRTTGPRSARHRDPRHPPVSSHRGGRARGPLPRARRGKFGKLGPSRNRGIGQGTPADEGRDPSEILKGDGYPRGRAARAARDFRRSPGRLPVEGPNAARIWETG